MSNLEFICFFVGTLVQLSVSVAFVTSVVTLIPSQEETYFEFERHWLTAWPSLRPRKFPAVRRGRRGEGCCLSMLEALKADEQMHRNAATLIFEVDALPFPDVNYTSFEHSAFEHHDIFFLFGHSVHCKQRCSLVLSKPWTEISFLWGTVSFLVPAERRLRVIAELEHYCLKQRQSYAVDEFLSNCGLQAVLATPLLVDHPRLTNSTTHGSVYRYDHAGDRLWWKRPALSHSRADCL
jgi:hypothetical protein